MYFPETGLSLSEGFQQLSCLYLDLVCMSNHNSFLFCVHVPQPIKTTYIYCIVCADNIVCTFSSSVLALASVLV